MDGRGTTKTNRNLGKEKENSAENVTLSTTPVKHHMLREVILVDTDVILCCEIQENCHVNLCDPTETVIKFHNVLLCVIKLLLNLIKYTSHTQAGSGWK